MPYESQLEKRMKFLLIISKIIQLLYIYTTVDMKFSIL